MAIPQLKKTPKAPSTPKAAEVAKAPRALKEKGVAVEDKILESTGFDYNPEGVAVGSKSATLEFIESLGDPSEPDEVKLGKGEDKVTKKFPRIIGYRFKVLEDMMVPDFGTTNAFFGKTLMDAADVTRWREAKAGEVIELTRTEVGALLSKPEFGGEATGGENHVRISLSLRRVNLKMENGSLQVNNANDLPGVALLMSNSNSSIKNLPIVPVLNYESNSSDENPYAEGVRTLLPEFEGTKWAPRALSGAKRRSVRRTATKTNKAEVAVKKYAAFGAMLDVLSKQAR